MKYLPVLIGLVIILSCTPQPTGPSITIDKHKFAVEVADEMNEWTTGLMYRDSMREDKGMIFVFPDEAPRSFWMKNTLIPLDMIFISSSNSIVAIQKDVQPCKADPCPGYPSPPAQYVLEINGNLSERYGFSLGDNVTFSLK